MVRILDPSFPASEGTVKARQSKVMSSTCSLQSDGNYCNHAEQLCTKNIPITIGLFLGQDFDRNEREQLKFAILDSLSNHWKNQCKLENGGTHPVPFVQTFSPQVIIQLESRLCAQPPPRIRVLKNCLFGHFLWYNSSITEQDIISKEFPIS